MTGNMYGFVGKDYAIVQGTFENQVGVVDYYVAVHSEHRVQLVNLKTATEYVFDAINSDSFVQSTPGSFDAYFLFDNIVYFSDSKNGGVFQLNFATLDMTALTIEVNGPWSFTHEEK